MDGIVMQILINQNFLNRDIYDFLIAEVLLPNICVKQIQTKQNLNPVTLIQYLK